MIAPYKRDAVLTPPPVVNSSFCDNVSFEEAVMNTFGVSVPSPKTDGRYHRFLFPDSNKRNGWYILSQDGNGTVFGAFGDWASQEHKKITFCSKRKLTPVEVEYQKQKMLEVEKELEKQHKNTKENLSSFYPSLKVADDTHPYLLKKHVKNYGCLARIAYDGRLVLPVMKDGEVTSLQYIDGDGNKKFQTGGEISGGHLVIKGSEKVFMAEGYATAASIHEATGATVVVAFNAGNLPKVARTFTNATIVADNDESRTGEKYAVESGLPYILVPTVGMDANDYANANGIDALRKILIPQEEEKDTWSVPLTSWLDQPAPLKWLIKGWIPQEGTITLFGTSNCGKTFVALDMMLSITTGQPTWWGHKVKKANVYYMCGEGYAGMRGRAKAWAIEHDVTDLGNINITKSAKDLINPKDMAEVIEDIDSLPWKPDLITIDTLNRFYSGDENAADKIHAFLDSIQTLEDRYSCSVMIITHTGVSAEAQTRARGSSALRGAMDCEFSVEKQQDVGIDGRPTGPALLLLTQRKQKDIEFLEPKGFRLKSVDLGWTDEDGEPVTSAVIESEDNIVKFTISDEDRSWLMLRDNFCKVEATDRTQEGWVITANSMKEFVRMWHRVNSKVLNESSKNWLSNSLRRNTDLGCTVERTVRRCGYGFYEVSFSKDGFRTNGSEVEEFEED